MSDIYSTVQFSIDLLYPFIKDEVSLIYGLKEQVKGIWNELNSMLALLREVDERAQDNESVKEWVKQVRTLAREIEDVIEEYKLFKKENTVGKVRQYMSLNVRSIATTIKSLHKKAIETARRKVAYSYRLNSGGSSSSSSCCGNTGGPGGSTTINSNSSSPEQEHNCRIRGIYQSTRFPVCMHMAQESEIVGAETASSAIMGLLGLQELDVSRLSPMIAVIGMRGVGKTTVVGSVYNDAMVRDYFPIRAWVSVSRPYNHVDILKNMIKQFYEAANELEILHKMSAWRGINQCNDDGRSDKITTETYTTIYRIDSMDEISLENLVRGYLKEKRYLVVVDDVQDHDGDRKLAIYIKSVYQQVIIITKAAK